MNRFDALVARLIAEHGEAPSQPFQEHYADEQRLLQDQRIFARLRHLVTEFDGLNSAELATINRVLFFREDVSPYYIWVVDLYLIRAHALEICRWPPTPFDELPADLNPAYRQYGIRLLELLRECAA